MDDRLSKALDFAKFRETLAIQRKTLKEKIDSKLTYGYNGGIFKIDRSLIAFVEVLISKQRTTDVPLIDANDNPVLVDDLVKFQSEILDRYFTATFEYLKEYEKIKKSRTVEKLLDL
jgi:hypothetical protein